MTKSLEISAGQLGEQVDGGKEDSETTVIQETKADLEILEKKVLTDDEKILEKLTNEQLSNLYNQFQNVQIINGSSLQTLIANEIGKRIIKDAGLFDFYFGKLGMEVLRDIVDNTQLDKEILDQTSKSISGDIIVTKEAGSSDLQNDVMIAFYLSNFLDVLKQKDKENGTNYYKIYEKLYPTSGDKKILGKKVKEGIVDNYTMIGELAQNIGVTPQLLEKHGLFGATQALIASSKMPDGFKGLAQLGVQIAPVVLLVWGLFQAIKSKNFGRKGILLALGADIIQSAKTGKSVIFDLIPSLMYGGFSSNLKSMGLDKTIDFKNHSSEITDKIGKMGNIQLFFGDFKISQMQSMMKNSGDGIDIDLEKLKIDLRKKHKDNPNDVRIILLEKYIEQLGEKGVKKMFKESFASTSTGIRSLDDFENVNNKYNIGGNNKVSDLILKIIKNEYSPQALDDEKKQGGNNLTGAGTASGAISVSTASNNDKTTENEVPLINENETNQGSETQNFYEQGELVELKSTDTFQNGPVTIVGADEIKNVTKFHLDKLEKTLKLSDMLILFNSFIEIRLQGIQKVINDILIKRRGESNDLLTKNMKSVIEQYSSLIEVINSGNFQDNIVKPKINSIFTLMLQAEDIKTIFGKKDLQAIKDELYKNEATEDRMFNILNLSRNGFLNSGDSNAVKEQLQKYLIFNNDDFIKLNDYVNNDFFINDLDHGNISTNAEKLSKEFRLDKTKVEKLLNNLLDKKQKIAKNIRSKKEQIENALKENNPGITDGELSKKTDEYIKGAINESLIVLLKDNLFELLIDTNPNFRQDKFVELYSNLIGLDWWVISDNNIDLAVDVGITIALSAISMGVGFVVARTALGAVSLLARTSRVTNILSKTGVYGRGLVFGTEIVVEGIAFHQGVNFMNNLIYSEDNLFDNWDNVHENVKSIAFMGVLKSVHKVIGRFKGIREGSISPTKFDKPLDLLKGLTEKIPSRLLHQLSNPAIITGILLEAGLITGTGLLVDVFFEDNVELTFGEYLQAVVMVGLFRYGGAGISKIAPNSVIKFYKNNGNLECAIRPKMTPQQKQDFIDTQTRLIEQSRVKNDGIGLPTGEYAKYQKRYEKVFSELNSKNIQNPKRSEIIKKLDKNIAKEILRDYELSFQNIVPNTEVNSNFGTPKIANNIIKHLEKNKIGFEGGGIRVEYIKPGEYRIVENGNITTVNKNALFDRLIKIDRNGLSNIGIELISTRFNNQLLKENGKEIKIGGKIYKVEIKDGVVGLIETVKTGGTSRQESISLQKFASRHPEYVLNNYKKFVDNLFGLFNQNNNPAVPGVMSKKLGEYGKLGLKIPEKLYGRTIKDFTISVYKLLQDFFKATTRQNGKKQFSQDVFTTILTGRNFSVPSISSKTTFPKNLRNNILWFGGFLALDIGINEDRTLLDGINQNDMIDYLLISHLNWLGSIVGVLINDYGVENAWEKIIEYGDQAKLYGESILDGQKELKTEVN